MRVCIYVELLFSDWQQRRKTRAMASLCLWIRYLLCANIPKSSHKMLLCMWVCLCVWVCLVKHKYMEMWIKATKDAIQFCLFYHNERPMHTCHYSPKKEYTHNSVFTHNRISVLFCLICNAFTRSMFFFTLFAHDSQIIFYVFVYNSWYYSGATFFKYHFSII